MRNFVSACLAVTIGLGGSAVFAELTTFNTVTNTYIDEGQTTNVTYGVSVGGTEHFSSGSYRYNDGPGIFSGPTGGSVYHTENVYDPNRTMSSRSGTLKYYQDGTYQTSVSTQNLRVYEERYGNEHYTIKTYNQTGSTRTITVRNVAPTITNFTVNGATVGSVPYLNIYEGQSVSANMTATDPGLYDDLRFVVDVDSASQVTLGTDYDTEYQRQIGGLVGDFTQSGPGYDIFELRGGVYDDDTVTWDNATIDIRVHNLNPIIDFISSSATIEVGDSFSFGASAHDPGDDPLLYRWDLDGDGYYDDLIGTGMTGLFDLGTHQFRLQVTDGDGGYASRGLTLNVVEPPSEAAVPEPSTYAGLLGITCVSLLAYGWRKRRMATP
ncbi:hypothetical protein CA54_53860 [Symmachiella macrocystis]|uniref:PKD/Chitinase domain-containing protein n=1 Tax=Symmachiella macrocystis TaxID=2527985 RepID=A0A5C6B5X1_9PLAN|nr:PEP-CTERM sorting domain-containing protein [Symmachiella macrocystis]TWU06982.1 hypothetical protein CA54_53860 [Symmachiella macrocystis]